MIHHQKIRNRENEKVKQFKPSSERTSLSDRDTEELLGLAVLNQNITQVEKIIIRYSTYLQLNDLDKTNNSRPRVHLSARVCFKIIILHAYQLVLAIHSCFISIIPYNQ